MFQLMLLKVQLRSWGSGGPIARAPPAAPGPPSSMSLVAIPTLSSCGRRGRLKMRA